MEIRTVQKFCIITPLSPRLDLRETVRLEQEINRHEGLNIGIDLSFAEDCTIDFLEMIKGAGISLFNIPSDIFSLFIIMNFDKIMNLYTTEEDFITNHRRLLNRNFCLV